ncbi:GAP family protein, partial [Mycobacterium celatum]
MWSSVLGLALLGALHPVRLGLTLLIISRPRPVLNLLAYWLGGLTLSVPVLLVPLVVVHSTPMFKSVTHESGTAAASSTVRHIQLGIGVFALSIAALMTVRHLARQRARVVTPENNPSSMAGSDTPIAIRRLLVRAQDAWENGSLWVAWVIGFVSVSVDGVLFVAAIIVASGAA